MSKQFYFLSADCKLYKNVTKHYFITILYKGGIKMGITKHEYHGYQSDASKWKAQCITIGDYKLYFSYDTLIAFETPKKCYTVDEGRSLTTNGHRYSVGNRNSSTEFVNKKILELLVYSELLKLPFEEAMRNANIHCERIH